MERLFGLSTSNTSISKELGAGLTTFMAMAYIGFVNPQMMASTGMGQGASFVATCLAAALASVLMGLYANWPVGLAPGMGLNAFFTYTIVGDMGYPWQTALGAVFIAGILFVVLTVTRLREWMLISIPWNLRIAMGAGIGLFVGLIGLKNGGIIVDHPATLLSLTHTVWIIVLIPIIIIAFTTPISPDRPDTSTLDIEVMLVPDLETRQSIN